MANSRGRRRRGLSWLRAQHAARRAHLSRHSRLKSSHNASHEEARFHGETCGELLASCWPLACNTAVTLRNVASIDSSRRDFALRRVAPAGQVVDIKEQHGGAERGHHAGREQGTRHQVLLAHHRRQRAGEHCAGA